MAKIKDIAKRAGVGVGTVSWMLNGSGYVAEETRKLIEIAMKELDYTPNELARNFYHIRKNRKVPQDVKFVAYDGTFITEMVEPKVTVIVQPIKELAKESVRLLSDLISGKEYRDEQVVLGVQLRKWTSVSYRLHNDG